MIQKLASPKKSIARSNGPKGTHGPFSVSQRSVACSGSKNRPSQIEEESVRWPGLQCSDVPGPNRTFALGNVWRTGLQ